MSECEYYSILEIDKNATEDDITKAYKRLALKYHPDRNPDKKEWAEDMFKKINEAKNVLIDPQQRRIYDQLGKEGLKNGGGNPFQGGSGNPFDVFAEMFGGGSHFQNVFNGFGNFGQTFNTSFNRREKIQQKVIQIPVNLETVYKGYHHNKRLKIESDCKNCSGTGKTEVVNCSGCNGKGVRVFVQQIGPGMIQQSTGPCTTCSSKGKLGKGDNCKDCSGKCKIDKLVSIDVNFEAGFNDGAQYKYTTENIEFIFIVSVEKHPIYNRNGNELSLEKTISLAEALCGTQFTLQLLDGKEVIVSSKENMVIKPNTLYRLKSLGINRADIVIKFNIVFPDRLDKEQQDKLSEILSHTYSTGDYPPTSEIYYLSE